MAVDWAIQQNNFLGRLDSWGSLFNSSSSEGSTDNWGMVDDVLGGVMGHMLLDGNLGNMMDLGVDLVSNMMDSWGSNSIGHSWGSNRLDLSSLNLNWGNSLDSNWGSSIGNSWSSNGMNSNSLADWI